MHSPLPAVEVADHRDAFRVRRPDGELGSFDAMLLGEMSAHLLIRAAMIPFIPEMLVKVGNDRREHDAGSAVRFPSPSSGRPSKRITPPSGMRTQSGRL